MENDRPDPDQLLARVQREERQETRGKLRIFFGACAGVGKTYAMLLAAREQRDEGVDVVIGLVETHGRKETAALLEGLEILPRQSIPYRGVELQELDLDAALARKPRLIVVDELAHTNAPGARHAKRWQDIDELLDAGIDVYSAMNVQHLESLNDVVGKITGIRVWETVPDHVFDDAHEVELVDLPPDELIERLHEGKVYMPEAAAGALQNFFRKGNLIALRELALRRTAERVDRQMREYRTDQGIEAGWPVAERIIVCVGPGANAERTVRAGARVAARMKGDWTAVYIETPRLQRLPDAERDRILRTMRLVEQLGGIAITLGGGNVADEILAYARASNATRIVVGRGRREGLRGWLTLSVADRIVAGAADLEVLVVGRDVQDSAASPAKALIARSREHLGVEPRRKQRWPGYAWAALAVLLATGVAALMDPFVEPANQVMIYLLGGHAGRDAARPRPVGARRRGLGPRVRFLLRRAEVVVRRLRHRVPDHVRGDARGGPDHQRPRGEHPHPRAHRGLPRAADRGAVRHEPGARHRGRPRRDAAHRGEARRPGVRVAGRHPAARPRRSRPAPARRRRAARRSAAPTCRWRSGCSTTRSRRVSAPTRCPGRRRTTCRSPAARATIGVLAILPANPRRVFVPEQQRLLETFASQIALALERAQLGADAEAERAVGGVGAAAQRPARRDLARPAHAARVDRRRLLEPARARRAHGGAGTAPSSRARSTRRRGGWRA